MAKFTGNDIVLNKARTIGKSPDYNDNLYYLLRDFSTKTTLADRLKDFNILYPDLTLDALSYVLSSPIDSSLVLYGIWLSTGEMVVDSVAVGDGIVTVEGLWNFS